VYLARRRQLVAGRMVEGGQPVPETAVTHSLLEMGWIQLATQEEEAVAVAEYGRPPEGVLELGWKYGPKGKGAPTAGLEVACPKCEAWAGDPCVTPLGALSKKPHKARLEPVAV